MIAHRYATFLCSLDVEVYVHDDLLGQQSSKIQEEIEMTTEMQQV